MLLIATFSKVNSIYKTTRVAAHPMNILIVSQYDTQFVHVTVSGNDAYRLKHTSLADFINMALLCFLNDMRVKGVNVCDKLKATSNSIQFIIINTASDSDCVDQNWWR